MRPIELTIKGINSYSEEQTVDFNALMREGVFGIFGPTGSGKSTILDGITLALYGELARKSKNFIHAGAESGSVSFTFSITEKDTRTYRVYRTFKVKKDTGYSVAAKARLCELVMPENEAEEYHEVVLEDSISGVKERIQKIVGLEFEDFTRTVVLPQGKFSEFLKLSGTDRNQMLERLFHLYDYGIALMDKVKKKAEQTELEYRTCLGKLAEHAGESEEEVAELKKQLRLIKKEQKEAKEKQKLFAEQFDEKRMLWEIQKELEEQLEEYRLLEEQRSAKEEQKKCFVAAQRAVIVRPFYEQVQSVSEEFAVTKKACEDYALSLQRTRNELIVQEKELEGISAQKTKLENGYPEKIHKLERACELEKRADEQKKQLHILEEKLSEQIEKGRLVDLAAEEQEALLQEQKLRLAQLEQAYYMHMEEVVRGHLLKQLEEEGVCPICGSVHEKDEKVHDDAATISDMPVTVQEESNRYQQMETLRAEIAKQESAVSAVKQEQLEMRTAIAEKKITVQAVKDSGAFLNDELCKLLEECLISGNPFAHKEKLEAEYRTICSAYEQSVQKQKAGKEELAKQEIQSARELARKEEQEKNLAKAEAVLSEKLAEQKFADIEQMKQSMWSREQIACVERELQEYETQYNRAKQQVEILSARIGEQRMEKEQYEAMLREKETLEEQLRICAEQIAVYTERIRNMEEALVIVGQLLAERKILEHRKAILSELMTLLKGKKFVEYVARERLSYVAGEASEKLLEITGGIFGLELKDSGEFVIRDYKNGGIVRNVNSLSGGEIFLVSLSLALALSTQIQLKGTAPLEFFFLDEGFGTLDESLLDTVMDSLDKLHHDRRKIGIISHVDAIKERVPVKLLVTPARVGEGGSRLEIAR